jgi:hypothetical protein
MTDTEYDKEIEVCAGTSPVRRSLPYHGIGRMTKEALDEFGRRHNPKDGVCTCGCNVPGCWIECRVHPRSGTK